MKANHDSVIGRNESITMTKRFRACGQIANSVYSDSKEELIKKVVGKRSSGWIYFKNIATEDGQRLESLTCILTEKQRRKGAWD